MARLAGKVAIITGAARGQGAEEARLFAREGAKVVLTDLQHEALEEVAKEINNSRGQAMAIQHDVSNEQAWAEVVKKAVNAFGKVDILVNNAGIFGVDGAATIDQVDLNSWEKFMKINATSQFLGIKAVLPAMRKNGGGSIVNISSLAGLLGGAAGIHYTASKGAVRLLSKDAAIELASDNIRVNSVYPGFIDTPMVSHVTSNDDYKQQAVANIPLGRIGQAEDVANAVLFLASDEASYITGLEMVVDGGIFSK